MAGGVSGQADIDALATVDEREAAVLLWNYHDEEKSAPSASTDISVRGLPKNAARVLVTHYRIDNTHSNAYATWQAMGSPQKPSAEQIAELKSKDGLQLLESPRWVTTENGAITIHTDMPRQSISLVQLRW
jgi:xylan 1,4-beta-xylosidase